jgi:hypothetical protein
LYRVERDQPIRVTSTVVFGANTRSTGPFFREEQRILRAEASAAAVRNAFAERFSVPSTQ